MSFQSIGVRCIFHLLPISLCLDSRMRQIYGFLPTLFTTENNNSPSPLSLERSFQEKPNIVPSFVFFSLQSHHIVNTMTHHAIFIPKRYTLKPLRSIFSPSRATTFLLSAEESFRLRGGKHSSPRRRKLVTADGRVFIDSKQKKAKKPPRWEKQ